MTLTPEIMKLWKLRDELTLAEAALLMLGESPEGRYTRFYNAGIDNWPDGMVAITTALQHALICKEIEGEPQLAEWSVELKKPHDVCLWTSTLKAASLQRWLAKRGQAKGFFENPNVMPLAFLDKTHPCYSWRLAAAVEAWVAIVKDGKFQTQGTPKQHLEKWLKEHAQAFLLDNKRNEVAEQAIADIAKIANWNELGGAGKTGSKIS